MTVDLLTIGLMCLLRLKLVTAGLKQTNNSAEIFLIKARFILLF